MTVLPFLECFCVPYRHLGTEKSANFQFDFFKKNSITAPPTLTEKNKVKEVTQTRTQNPWIVKPALYLLS